MRVFAQRARRHPTPSFNLGRSRGPRAAAGHKAQHVVRLQRPIGSQAVQQLMRSNAEGLERRSGHPVTTRFGHNFSRVPMNERPPAKVQAKLTVNSPADSYEREADRVADQVVRMPELELQRTCACGGACPECRRRTGQRGHEEGHLQTRRTPDSHGLDHAAPALVQETLDSPGQRLDPATRQFMESRFGHDFGLVRVHANAKAAESTRAVNAQAYTVGRDIAFGAGQYAPHTNEGRRLLAHELTHVVHQRGTSQTVPQARRSGAVLQRKNKGAKPAKKTYPYSVTTSGCAKAPFTKAGVEAAARQAFLAVRDSNCVKTQSLKDNILGEFNGLNIECEQGKDKPCGRASQYFSHTVNIYPTAFDPGCGPLEATILHEVIHLTEWAPFGHGALAGACEKACFGWGSGDASKCTFETGFVPVLGASAGAAFPSEGRPGLHARLYLGLEKRGPILGFVHPSLGIGLGLIGETPTGEPGAPPAGPSALVSLLAGLRLDPGEPGGSHISFFGGPAVALGGGERAIGAEAGVALGYRWRWLDFSVDAGLAYDPTREAGMDRLFTLGASIKIGPSVPR